MKQTAVEWLVQKLSKEWQLEARDLYLINQAKEMEKQQIIEAWIAEDNPLQRLKAEQYYNETFKQ
jgi:hypothetical protein